MHPALRFAASAILASHLFAAAAAPSASPGQAASAALDASKPPVIDMQHTSWSTAAGAPTGVSGIDQTPDGWLWIGSTAGLFRFDGVRFQRPPPALSPLSSNISGIGVLPDGALWIAYRFGGASLLKDGRMRHFRPGEHQMPGGTSGRLGLDGTGRLWLAGRVGLRTVDIGNLVGSGDANGIAVITQFSPIDVEFAVPQDGVPELQSRIVANATLPAVALDRTRTNELAQGRFAALDNQVDVQTGTVRAKARFENKDNKLFPSQFVNLRLQVRTIENAVVVPVNALRHGANGDFVFVLNEQAKTVSMRGVKRGQATVDKIQVLEGLKPGERVITEGADRLKDGAKVTLPGERPQGAQGQGGERPRRQREGSAQ
ncbi:MAG TPA: hypothetical protein DDX04_18055 [Massilia sp.]|nr:hypothetical protein [Massilia sp.]